MKLNSLSQKYLFLVDYLGLFLLPPRRQRSTGTVNFFCFLPLMFEPRFVWKILWFIYVHGVGCCSCGGVVVVMGFLDVLAPQ